MWDVICKSNTARDRELRCEAIYEAKHEGRYEARYKRILTLYIKQGIE